MSLGAWLALASLWLAVYVVTGVSYRRAFIAHPYQRDVAAVGLLALLTTGFFWRVLFSDNVWMPAGGGDMVSLLYPVYHFAATNFRQGIIPLWNPHLYGGVPFAGDIQSGLFYPLNLAIFLLAPQITYRTLQLMVVVPIFLAGLFMYLLLRNLGPAGEEVRLSLSRPAALAGATAFMFSDFFITHLGNLNLNVVAAWLPLVFLFFHRAVISKRPAPAAGAGICLGLAVLAGHIQPFLYMAFLLGIYTLYRVYLTRTGWRTVIQYVALLTLALALAVGIAAIVLIPGYEFSALSQRAEFSYEEASRFSLAPGQLVGLLVPALLGRGPAEHWDPWDRVEVGYIGILPLLLAGFGAWLRRDDLSRFFIGLALLSLLLALGGYSVLYGWLYQLVPGFHQMRAPARFVYLTDFALAALAAFGLQALLRPIPLSQRRAFGRLVRLAPWALLATTLLTVPPLYTALLLSQDKDPGIFQRVANAFNGLLFFLLLLAGCLMFLWARRHHWVGRRTLAYLAVGFIFLDLASLGSNLDVGTTDPSRTFDHQAAIAFLQEDRSLYRVETPMEVWHVWQPNSSLLYRLFDVGGVYNPLLLADYTRYLASMGGRSSPLYDLLNAKYVIGSKDLGLEGKLIPVFDEDPGVNIYLNTRALSRAFMVYNAQIVASHEEALTAIQQPDFNPGTTVILEEGEPLAAVPSHPALVSFVSYSVNDIVLTAETAAEGYLFLSEVYYPGWQAYVDNQPTPVLRANYLFRALRLPPGSHRVRLTYSPLSWRIGLGISLATGLGLLAWGGYSLGRRMRKVRR
ncbi:MAG: YfhO family protein [Anaerolineae bacterium]